MVDLYEKLNAIATKHNFKLKEIEGKMFTMDVTMKYPDGGFRYQLVYIWIANRGRIVKKPCIYINSRIGLYSKSVSLYGIMKEAGYGVYSNITIVDDKDSEGNAIETIIVQASPYVEDINDSLLKEAIIEVASTADLLEMVYFGVDKN